MLREFAGKDIKLMGPDGIFHQAFIKDATTGAAGAYVTFGLVPPSKLTGKGADWYASHRKNSTPNPIPSRRTVTSP
ncbi:MAG: hypothetical protein LC797_19060 [Chloroflexi bacterium]|nr:hypothetical protein [Chloroflexota bacterium]